MNVSKRQIFFWLLFWISSFTIGLVFPIIQNYQNISVSSNRSVQSEVLGEAPETGEVISSDDYLIKNTDINFDTCQQENTLTVYESPDPYSVFTIVDKNHRLPEGFAPPDLVYLDVNSYPVLSDMYLRSGVIDPLLEMTNALKVDGINLKVKSGWRTLITQEKIFNLWTSRIGISKANSYAALPGFSEHHLGTAVDFSDGSDTFQGSRGDLWLRANAYKYGFIMSYPQGKESLTGYAFEPWHYRYIGAEATNVVVKKNITLTEYLYMQNDICVR